jgi:hypothetical protein
VHTLREFGRTPRVRHVESRLEEDIVVGARDSKRREARRRINCAEAWTLYPLVAAAVAAPARYSAVESLRLARGGAGEADLRHGGDVERWRQNGAASEKSRGGGAGRE